MTSPSDRVYVWTWLPGSQEPVVAGVIERSRGVHRFAYGESYLARPEAISLYGPELPLRKGWIDPAPGLTMASCLRDGSPDSWGRRVILAKTGKTGRDADTADLDELTYFLESGSNRLGANDFQAQADVYVPRRSEALLDELHAASERLDAGEPLSGALNETLAGSSAMGGARPKANIAGADGTQHIAKFSKASDEIAMVNAEAAALELARRVGVQTTGSKVVPSLGKEVLLVERFDRDTSGHRAHVVSGLTMQALDEQIGARYGSYPEILDRLREYGADPGTAQEMFRRIVFNVAVSNTDDHARNHAAFWDGGSLTLTPAFDLCPQTRVGETARQAMVIDREGNRDSNFATCLKAAPVYGLDSNAAREIIDQTVDVINESWDEAADEARLPGIDRDLLWGRQILNPYASYDYAPRATRPGWSAQDSSSHEQPRRGNGQFDFKHLSETDPELGLD